jgi:hypothetical protein
MRLPCHLNGHGRGFAPKSPIVQLRSLLRNNTKRAQNSPPCGWGVRLVPTRPCRYNSSHNLAADGDSKRDGRRCSQGHGPDAGSVGRLVVAAAHFVGFNSSIASVATTVISI